jgi:hypothetical protein
MSGLRPNSVTLYLRPIENIPPYRVRECAQWLVNHRKFPTVDIAHRWLLLMEDQDPWKYKAILANYFDAVDYTPSYVDDTKNVNDYRSSNTNYYGEEPHMGWRQNIPGAHIKYQL